MPHPKKHLKLTGDTHPPELDHDLGLDEDAEDDADQRQPSTALSVPVYEPSLAARARAQPLAALGIGLAALWLLSKVFRR